MTRSNAALSPWQLFGISVVLSLAFAITIINGKYIVRTFLPSASAQIPPSVPPPPSGDNNRSTSLENYRSSNSSLDLRITTQEIEAKQGIVAVEILHIFPLASINASYIEQDSGNLKIAKVVSVSPNLFETNIIEAHSNVIFMVKVTDGQGNVASGTKIIYLIMHDNNVLYDFYFWLKSIFLGK